MQRIFGNGKGSVMTERTKLSGRFTRLHIAYLQQRAAKTSDPRHVFYRAMLETDTYEAYLAATKGRTATTGNRIQDGTDGRAEILYARRNRRIVDFSET